MRGGAAGEEVRSDAFCFCWLSPRRDKMPPHNNLCHRRLVVHCACAESPLPHRERLSEEWRDAARRSRRKGQSDHSRKVSGVGSELGIWSNYFFSRRMIGKWRASTQAIFRVSARYASLPVASHTTSNATVAAAGSAHIRGRYRHNDMIWDTRGDIGGASCLRDRTCGRQV